MNQTAAVITVSDKGFRGERKDTSGPALCAMLAEEDWEVVFRALVPDEAAAIQRELKRCADELHVALVLTTGGTGFSPRDVTPEATMSVLERMTPGLPELMRAESMKLTPHGCLSRAVAGIRGRTLIVNLPGSEKAARENLYAVLRPLHHGVKMLQSEGSADCAAQVGEQMPSLDAWLREAKRSPAAEQCGMYLFHNGAVRRTARAEVRDGVQSAPVAGMDFSYDPARVEAAVQRAREREGIAYVRVWLNRGRLSVGDDLMLVLVGGDIRPRVSAALLDLVAELKRDCVTETELA